MKNRGRNPRKARTRSVIGLAFLFGALLLSGCGTPTTPTETEAPGLTGTIETTGIQIDQQQVIATGWTTLPEGTCIQTQLYADEEPVPWWPTATCADLQASEWQTVVNLDKAGALDALDHSAQYVLHAWSSTDPNIKAEPFYFDLIGPPS